MKILEDILQCYHLYIVHNQLVVSPIFKIGVFAIVHTHYISTYTLLYLQVTETGVPILISLCYFNHMKCYIHVLQ